MPLVLTLKSGEQVYIGERAFGLEDVAVGQHLVVRDLASGDRYHLVGDRGRQVMPNVFMAMGDRGSGGTARVVIDAPRTLRVLHGNKYRALKAKGIAIRAREAKESTREYEITRAAAQGAQKLGIATDALLKMMRQSTPITGLNFNRRCGDTVMCVDEHNAVTSIGRLTPAQRAYYDGRRYRGRLRDRDG
jgi:hypothetical protein